MREYDRDNTGRIEFGDFYEISKEILCYFSEFIVSRKFRERDPTEEILKAFRLFDDDKDGNIIILTKNINLIRKNQP